MEIILLAIALGIDCFTVSISCGIIQRKMGGQVWVMAFFFGLFQAIMPFIGWLGAYFLKYDVEAYDHWIAFFLLALLGGKMIREYFNGESEVPHFNPSRFSTILILALATSIDALAVGFSFTGMGVDGFENIGFPILIIGLFSFILTLNGKYIGVKIGRRFNCPAELIGGLIFLAIGAKVLYLHLSV
ncbi:putative manganese efflux pump MntP [Bacteroidaceae bacterium]|uniref:manganese efflux pump MntP n=1 Tax=Prevotella sp. MGM2 TaxID=2033406 RepID=UPI000CEA5948|nr:manganese efflux pump MntP family protein [Prevotella sp. MGM2]GAY30313.1 manganese efflux pump [Prevotella sp. MGM2]GFI33866.1 putative manganese efflux pump MntP [Bacteroidaceae bacterium]